MPSAELRQECRKDRERFVRKPMIALFNDLADLDDALEDYSIWSYGKHPWWWQHQTGLFRIAPAVEIGLRFDLDGLHVKGAWHYPDPGQVSRYRRAVAGEDTGPHLVDVLEELRGKGYEITGDVMKRMPRGFQPDHARAELLRHRTMIASTTLTDDEVVRTSKAVDRVADAINDLMPMMTWFADNTRPEQTSTVDSATGVSRGTR